MPELLDLAVRIAGWAAAGEQVEAYVARGRDTEVVAYEGDVESLSSAESEGVGIRVIRDQRQGFAYAGSLSPDVVEETLAEARDNVAFASPDEFLDLAEPDEVPPADLDLWREELVTFPTERKVELALELERAVRAADPRVRALRSASWSDGMVEAAVATSTGIAATTRRTGCFVSAMAIAGEGDDTQTGVGYSVGRAPLDVDVAAAAADAVTRATRLLGATKPPSGRVPVVFDPRVASSFLSILTGTFNGESVLKGRSLFAGRVGEQVAAPLVTFADDPTEPLAYAAAAFDAEGLACRRVPLITDGVLQGFTYNTYAGRRADVPSTGSAVRAGFKSTPGVGCRAASLQPGDLTHEEILRQVGDGLLVLGITGMHSGVNPISGDFSVGAEGVLISGGATTGPVREITIASTIQRMLKDVVAIGSDVEWLPSIAAGVTLAFGEMSMSGA